MVAVPPELFWLAQIFPLPNLILSWNIQKQSVQEMLHLRTYY